MLGKGKILLVEDELIEAMNFEEILKSSDFDVVGIASSGEEAINKAFKLEPDLILMDIVLKGKMDGIEVASKINERLDIPIVYLTAHPEENTINRAKLTSPYGYLIKPVNKTYLKNTIELALAKHETEMQLKESEEKYRNFFNEDLTGDFVAELDGTIIEFNPAFVDIYGLKDCKQINEVNLKQMNPQDWEQLIKDLKQGNIIKGYQSIHQKLNGDKLHILANFIGIYNKNGQLEHIRGYITDETQRVEVEKSLQNSEQLLYDIIDFLPDATFAIDQESKVIIWNRAIEEKTGINKEEILGKGNYAYSIPPYGKPRPSLIDLVNDDSLNINSKYDFIRKKGQTLYAEVFAPLVNDGDGDYIRIKASPLLDNDGKQYGAIESIHEITEYKDTLKSLQRNEKRLKAIMESVTDVIITTDLNGNILFSNEGIKTIFGYDPDEIIGKNLTLLIPERHREQHLNGSRTFQISKKTWRSIRRIKMIGTRKDGTEFPLEISLAMWKSGDNEYITAIIRDITEQEKANEVLRIEHELAVALSESSDLIEILEICLDAAIRISKMDSGGLYLVDDNSGDLNLIVHSGLSPDFAASASHYKADSPSAQIIMAGQPVYTHYNQLDVKIPKSRQKENLQVVGIIPIQYDGKVIGCLNIASHIHDDIPKQNKNALKTITGLISGAIIRSKTEKALLESEKKYRELVDNSLVAIYETTLNGEILFANDAMVKMFEYDDIEDLKVNNIDKLYKKPVKRNEFVKTLQKNHYLTQYEIKGISKNGKIIDTIVSAILHDNIVSGMIIDISKNKQTERALQESEEKYRTLFEADPDYTMLLSLDGVLIDINPAAEQMIGLSRKLLLGKHFLEFDVLLKENLDQYKRMFEIVQKNGNVGSFETKIFDKNGEIRWVRIISTIIDKGKNSGYILVIGSDITERKLAEEELKSSLEEKDLLLKEIHHRVKNNLQIISSLLDLQKPFVEEDPIALNVLKGSRNRVVSMAMIHEMLYQSKDLNSIKISDYIINLISHLFHSYIIENDIKPVIHVEDFYLNIETSIPLGLIISEIISNSLKYAFPDGEAGEITISLQCHNTHFELIISDNGIGFPENIDIKNVESSLGLQLVNSLVNQIDGTIELDRTQGTKYTIIFNELEYKKRV